MTQSWLGGFSDFGRSFNLGTLSEDAEVKEMYRESEKTGKLKFNRSKVMFLGDARVGKTSLRRLLMGEKFQPNEASTERIETRMCEAKEVNSLWEELKGMGNDDFQEGASWVTAKAASKVPSTQLSEKVRQNTASPEPPVSVGTLPRDILYVSKFLLTVMMVCAIPSYHGFTMGFAFLEWTVYLSFALCGAEWLISYRFGTGVAILIAFDKFFRHRMTLPVFLSTLETVFHGRYYLTCVAFSAFFVCTGFVLGSSFGFGCRTGIAFGLCILLPPEQIASVGMFEWSKASIDFTAVVDTLVCFLGNITAVLLCRYVFTTNVPVSLRHAIFVVIASTSIASLRITVPALLTFLFGCLFWIGTINGVFVGRHVDKAFDVGYPIKKLIGTLLGIFQGLCMGWAFWLPDTSPLQLLIFFISVLTHPLIELYVFTRVRRQSVPIVQVRDAFKQQAKGAEDLPRRLSLWDFAGDTLYYTTHQVFISSHAVYLIVFSLLQATENPQKQLDRILFWLHSVQTHAKHKDAVIFLVGTHRDSVDIAKREKLCNFLQDKLYDVFCDRLIVNDKGFLTFVVENSRPLESDAHQLRSKIWERTQDVEYLNEEFPVRFLHFYKVIKKRRQESEQFGRQHCICTNADVMALVRESCGVEDESEMHEMLKYPLTSLFSKQEGRCVSIFSSRDCCMKNSLLLECS
ncbi:uncharacterized protein [Ptychodera flava]|uniref:uncharacterized protein n=1 Tax=Ptychodera flava TaxID=63121 RepID=UPI00396A2355